MIEILHNPRCRKSREGLALLEQSGKDYKIINYLEEPLTKTQLSDLLKKLKLKPIALVRTNESIWKEKFKGKTMTDHEIVDALLKYPKLIERPIVSNDTNAAIGRPAEHIKSIINP